MLEQAQTALRLAYGSIPKEPRRLRYAGERGSLVIVGGDAGRKDPTDLIYIARATNRITHLSVMFTLAASTLAAGRRSLDRQPAATLVTPSRCDLGKALQAKIGRACLPLVIFFAYTRAVEVTKNSCEWSLCRRG